MTKKEENRTPKARVTYSRRKFGAAVKVLKQALANDKLPLQTKLRCVELLMLLYDVELPDSSRRDQKAIRQLVSERSIDRALHADIRAEVAARVEAEAEQHAKGELYAALEAFLKPTRSPQEQKEAVSGAN